MDVKDIRRFTPLMMAACEGHHKVVNLLVEAKCNISMTAYNRRTALHYAAEQGHVVCCEVLVEAGLGIDHLDADGCTAAMWAARKGHVVVSLRALFSQSMLLLIALIFFF